jgi:hypothetical protein
LTSLNWSIGAGSYWLVAIAPTGTLASPYNGNGWQDNTPDGTFAYTSGGTWFAYDSALPEAIVTATAVTPLPPAWTMLIAGLVGFGFFAHRGLKKNETLAVA